MASDESDIIWRRGSEGEASDIWDDTALIEAYDKAVSQIKDDISERRKSRRGSGKKKRGKRYHKSPAESNISKMNYGDQIDWKVGDLCIAIYSEDNLKYEAEILQVNKEGGTCLVKYRGYGNEETVNLSDLNPSHGHLAKQHLERQKLGKTKQEVEANGFHNGSQSHQHTSCSSSERHCQQPIHFQPPTAPHHRIQHHEPYPSSTFAENMPHIPPPPVFPIDDGIVPEEEALASMLMSWYMSGYHTGFYQGQKQSSRHSCNCRCSNSYR